MIMINVKLKIREKDFSKAPTDMWIADKYPEYGFYKATDGVVVNLLYVGIMSEGVGILPIVFMLTEWSIAKQFFKDDISVDIPKKELSTNVSEVFALNMLSVAIHGKKAE